MSTKSVRGWMKEVIECSDELGDVIVDNYSDTILVEIGVPKMHPIGVRNVARNKKVRHDRAMLIIEFLKPYLFTEDGEPVGLIGVPESEIFSL